MFYFPYNQIQCPNDEHDITMFLSLLRYLFQLESAF